MRQFTGRPGWPVFGARRLGQPELAYRFVDIETLVADFLRDVEALQ